MKIVEERKLYFLLRFPLQFFNPLLQNLIFPLNFIIFPPPLHFIIYIFHPRSHPLHIDPTSTPHRPYIDPTSTPH